MKRRGPSICHDGVTAIFRGLTGRALAISATRLMNYGLVLISPVVLVRLLSAEEFGRYREFLVYAVLLGGISAFGINSSLLRFVPENPASAWRFVNQAILMTLVSSIFVAGGMLTLDSLFGGQLVGEYALPLAFYVLFFVNLDFWEFLWLAEKRGSAVLRYTTARLVARIVVVTTSAWLTRDVMTIIWSLVCLEALRLMISGIGWYSRARETRTRQPARWREQLSYCLPYGSALVVVAFNKSIGQLFVAKLLGPVALAQYVIGTYLQPVIGVIRNSLSDVVLPEMSSKRAQSAENPLELWRRSTVVTGIFLFAASVVLARFADVLVTTLFSETYRPAVLVFQIYLLVFLRETFDFGLPLRAINQNAPILHSSLLCIAVRAALLLIAVPIWGLLGAVIAVVISRFAEGSYLAHRMARAYGLPLRSLAPWGNLLKIFGAALLAGGVLYGDFWTDHFGIFGVIPAGAIYLAAYAALLGLVRVPEVGLVFNKLRSSMPVPAFRRQ